MQSPCYSLTATTTTEEPTSDLSFSSPSSFLLRSLSPAPTEQPSMLLMSVGTLINFVPRSAVKLVSLDTFTAFGYNVHTEKDRSIIITDPTGITICFCPIQSNNTWIFPNHLLTGAPTPKTVVTTGTSAPFGTAELPPRALPHHQAPPQLRPKSQLRPGSTISASSAASTASALLTISTSAASTLPVTASASTLSATAPASTLSATAPAFTLSATAPASTLSATAPASTLSATATSAASTLSPTATAPASALSATATSAASALSA